MLILFFVLAGGTTIANLMLYKKYVEYIRPLDEKVYRLKIFFPISLFFLESFKYQYTTAYDRRLLSAVTEISGPKNAQYYLRIHWSGKITAFILALLFCSFIGGVSKPDSSFMVFSLLLLGGAIYLPDRELHERVKRRRTALQLDFPDFINKLILLVNAGMTVTKAWEKITVDNRKNTPLYRELNIVLQDIKAGKPEHRAYEEFAKRCRTPGVTRFVSVILQNLRKGNSELVPILRVLSNECWEMRKSIAKKQGEEASTKLLLPMMLMFVAILIIVGTPAVLALRGI